MTKTEDGSEPVDEQRAHVVERPRAHDQLYEAFPNRPVNHAIDPQDGLPSPVIPHSVKDALAPSLSRETLVCLGDYSEFVLRDEWGQVLRRYRPDEVEEAPDGRFRVRLSWLQRWVSGHRYVEVQPLRPKCRHYAAQMVEFPHDAEHRFVVRHCQARRVDYGDFLSLNDSAMFACELRDPPVGNNAAMIRAFDDRAIELAQESQRVAQREDEEFDLEAALANESAGGIFGAEAKDDEE